MRGRKIISTIVAITMIFSAMVVLNQLTDFKFVETTSAYPGINAWEGNGTIAAPNGDVLNTSTSELVYDPDTPVAIYVNGSLNWSTTYYLYYPVYYGNYGDTSYNLTWKKYVSTDPSYIDPEISATDHVFGGPSESLEAKVKLNHTGLWLIDNDSVHDCSNLSQMRSTVPAWFWVNTSPAFTMSISDTSFYFGETGSITIDVDTGTYTNEALVAISNQTGHLVGYWNGRNQMTSGGKITVNKNASVFTNAGKWYVDAYWDVDSDAGGSHTNYLNGTGGSGYNWYNATTYGNDSGLNTSASLYNPYLCGPWDPPEYNVTTRVITVQTGRPTINTVNTTNVYWGFELNIEVNVTDPTGAGITGGNVSLKKIGNSTWVYNQGPYTNVWINETGNGNYTIQISRYTAGSPGFWALGNGTFKIYFAKDVNGDGVEEWNYSKTFTISSSTPPVNLKIINDGSGDPDDLKVDVPAYNTGTNAVGTINITFEITGRSVSGTRAYYGDNTGWEDRYNITVTGDILLEPTGSTLTCSGHTWTLTCTPTKPGGTITISINWPGSNNGTDSETIYIINGTTVTPAIDEFTIKQHVNLTVNVKDKWDNPVRTGTVNLTWNGTTTLINSTTGDGSAGNGDGGDYTFWITPSEQGTTAPRYIIVAAKTPGTSWWGYAKVKVAKNHNLYVNMTPTTSYAGNATLYDINILVNDESVPATYSDITIALYNETGSRVTSSSITSWSSTTGQYKLEDQEIILAAGTYQIYAYNNTHDTEGHNGTIVVTPYTVTCNPSVLAWLIDTNVNITFQVTPAGNGTLTIENMSGAPNCSDTTSSGYGIQIINGVGTIANVNATTLGNVTFDYTPDGGAQREAEGLLQVTTAVATPNPDTIYIGEPTLVEITVTHPATGEPLENVRVGLDHGLSLNQSKLAKLPADEFTDSEGKVQFSITAEASGNITIYIKNGSDPNNKYVIKSAARKTMTISADPSVNEGGTFTVEAKDSTGNLITDATVSIKFNGVTYTTTTGTVELTAPTVSESIDYKIEATATGYTSASTTIKVVNIPKLSIAISGKKEGDVYISPVTVTVYDDTGKLLTGATVTFGTQSDTTINGQVEFSVTHTTAKDYTITATFPGFEDADSVTIKVKASGTPGFELLTLIAAIGVAFILLRRRRH